MMKRNWMRGALCAALAGFGAVGATQTAAQTSWVQIEAVPSQSQGQARAESYAQRLPDVNGFFLGAGWYGIALGPYAQDDARNVLARLRSTSAIPADSFIVDGSQFRNQFYPSGATAPNGVITPVEPTPDAAPEPDTGVAATEPDILAEPDPAQPDETQREAQASEALLSRPEKEMLQIALQWAGYYTAAIDGSFGRGTRGSMAAWQEANGYEVTGVLTTLQRSVLLASYNAVLDGMGMQRVRDEATGIEIEIPAGVMAFAAYAPPFARYEPTGDVPATVLLISQPGDQSRLFGLYEILQTLEVVPTEGPRERNNSSFTIEGIDATTHTYTYVTLENNEIKGFMLVWPTNDEERRTRIVQLMQASFARIDGVLDPGVSSPGEEQAVDLVSGLAIRQPIRSRSGFYLDRQGAVLTTTEAVEGCGEIILDTAHTAAVVHRDDALGLAVVRPADTISPVAVAEFQTGIPRLQSQVAVAGYPYGGLLSAPSMTFGALADVRGLNGETELKRLDLLAQEGDAGGPVFDNGGAVIGMLLPRETTGGQVLPDDVSFSVNSEALMASLDAAGIRFETTRTVTAASRELLTRRAADVTVLVSCWE